MKGKKSYRTNRYVNYQATSLPIGLGNTMEEDLEAEELGTGAKGKRGELTVIGELLTHGLQVFLPVVDMGVDCVVDIGDGNYREVQIKYRENRAIFNARFAKPRDNFFIVCWLNDHGRDDFWAIPSKVFFKLGHHGTSKGRKYIQLIIGKQGSPSYAKLQEYHHNFTALISGATPDVHAAVQTASRRVEGQHFKQPDFEKEILLILSEATGPLSSLEIIRKLKARLESQFSQADLEVKNRGKTRWENTARFAIYQGLKKKGLIQAKTKNQWIMTSKGLHELSSGK